MKVCTTKKEIQAGWGLPHDVKKRILLSQLCTKVLPETEHLGEQFGVSNSMQFLHLSAEREYKEEKTIT